MAASVEMMLRLVEKFIQKRASTDRRMGYVWMIIPILPIVVGVSLLVTLVGIVVSSLGSLQSSGSQAVTAIAGIFGLYAFALAAIYSILLLGAFAFYYLIDRRNRHFNRQRQLFKTLSEYLASKNDSLTSENVAKLSLISEETILEEQERPAGVWAVLYVFVTPIVGLVVAYTLTQDLRKHEGRQLEYQQSLPLALEEAGLGQPQITSFRRHNRDPILFMVLSAITAGLFWIYWFYTLLKDYNEHFADQALFEDQILASLKPSSICSSCGGSIPQGAKFCPLCGAAQSPETGAGNSGKTL